MNSKKYLLTIFLLSAIAVAGESQTPAWEKTSWRQTLYYQTTYGADIDSDQEVVLHVAAVDSYEVYFNGALVGVDTLQAQMTTYPVTLSKGDNFIALKVANRGRGTGNGVMLALVGSVADTSGTLSEFTFAESTTDRSQLVWFWTDQPQGDDAWTTSGSLGADTGWHFVQGGLVGSRIIETYDPDLEIIAGFPGGVDIGSEAGGIVLKQIRGENLARGSATNRDNAVDGDMKTSWDLNTNALGFAAELDLQTRHNLNSIRVLTKGNAYKDNSLKGYAIQTSDDQIRWSEVASLVDIGDIDSTQWVRSEVSFRSTWTRYLRLLVTQINGVTGPKVAEIQVFGEGFTDRGSFLSEPLDFGSPDTPKNFGRVSWQATVPGRTELSLQFRSGDDADDFTNWASWSSPVQVGENGRVSIDFPAAEPQKLLQYRVNMISEDPALTPVFEGIQLNSWSGDIPASVSRGRVEPNRVAMGVDTTFVYTLNLEFAADDVGIERIEIEVPSNAELIEDQVPGLKASNSTQKLLELVFEDPVKVDELKIPFKARSFANVHDFRAMLYGPDSENPLNVAQNTELDPLTSEPYSWTAIATTAMEKTLSEVRANPPVFSPNGDNINDDTVIEFILSKVDTPRQVNIKILDLSGRVVAKLITDPVIAGTFLRGTGPQDSPGYWNGRGVDGTLVPPGIYIYQIELDLDEDDEIESGIVGVVY